MKELGIALFIIIVLFFVLFTVDSLVGVSMNSDCRDYGYPDAVYIKNYGWYCVGISDETQSPFLVEFETAVQ